MSEGSGAEGAETERDKARGGRSSRYTVHRGLHSFLSPFTSSGRSTPRRSSSAPYSHILDLEVKDERPTGREDEPREMGCGAVSWIPL